MAVDESSAQESRRFQRITVDGLHPLTQKTDHEHAGRLLANEAPHSKSQVVSDQNEGFFDGLERTKLSARECANSQ